MQIKYGGYMTISNAATVINHLNQEIQWVDALNALLIQEKECLVAREFASLEVIAENKTELSTQLEKSAEERVALMSVSYPTFNPKELLQAFLMQCTAEEARMIKDCSVVLAEKLTTCRELNIVNGQVIASNLYVRQEMMNVLSGKTNNAGHVYTASGSMQGSPQKGHYEQV